MTISKMFALTSYNGDKWFDSVVTSKDLFARYRSLRPRDLNIIDENKHFKISYMTHRDDIILIKFDYIRCIITQSCVDFIIGKRHTPNDEIVIKKLFDNIRKASVVNDFEIRIIECILMTVTEFYDKKINDMKPLVSSIVADVTKDSDYSAADGAIIPMLFQVNDIYDILVETLVDNIPISGHIDKQKYNDLLSFYVKEFEDNKDELEKMERILKAYESRHNTQLARKRNSIAEYNLRINLIILGISCSNLITSFFGMNIKNHLESSTYALIPLIIILLLVIYVTYRISLEVYKRA